jgi:hypothetical protein
VNLKFISLVGWILIDKVTQRPYISSSEPCGGVP